MIKDRFSGLIGEVDKTYFLFWGSGDYVMIHIDTGVEDFILKGERPKNIFPVILHRSIKVED